MKRKGAAAPLVVLGLDAAELELVQRWIADDTLPNLARLQREGVWAPLDGIHDFTSFSVWPTFATGAPATDHGYYSHMQLATGTYGLEATNALKTMRIPPWWAQLNDRELRCCIFDVPKMWPFPGVNGVQILEWGAKSPAANPKSDPPGLAREFKHRYGVHRGTLLDEDVAESPAYFEKLLKALIASVRQRANICVDLMRRESWDLFIHVFSETHSVGHRFIHFFEGDTSRGNGHERRELRDAVQQIYQEIDTAIGRIREAASKQARFVCCSVHGMELNENAEASELLPELLRRYSGIDRIPLRRNTVHCASRLLMKAYGLTPPKWRDTVKHYFSQGARKHIRMRRMLQTHDQVNWARMKAFSLPTDEGAFIRINLKGREPLGCVSETDYPVVVEELCGIFSALRDPTTGKAAVAQVYRVQEEKSGAAAETLPDIIVQWAQHPVRALESPRFGYLGKYYPHRAGTHSPHGFMIAAGPEIPSGNSLIGGSVLDLAPTLLHLLDEPLQPHMTGRALVDRSADSNHLHPA